MADEEQKRYARQGLKVQARQTEQGDHVQFGVEIDGAWFPFAGFPTPGFEQTLADAEAAKSEAEKSKPASK